MAYIDEIIYKMTDEKKSVEVDKFEKLVSTSIDELSQKANECCKAKDLEAFNKIFDEVEELTSCQCMTIKKAAKKCIQLGCDADKIMSTHYNYIDNMLLINENLENMRDLKF